ncbi:MAG TPA: hypothetical protein VD866_23895 [Urbifossiella sp.]|nr:hypothetical protein [Urbifossiella sp.]
MFRSTLAVALASLGFAAAAEPPTALEAIGAKVTVTKGVVTQASVNTEALTPEQFRTLGAAKSLKRLSTSGKGVTDATLPLLAGLTELEELSTDQTRLTDDGYKHFAQFRSLRQLSLFHPSWDMKEFTGRGLAHLKALPKLERLTFAGSTAGDEALAALAEVTQLKGFSTWHTMQTQAGNVQLTKLSLTSLKIGQRLPRYGKNEPPSFDESTVPTLARMKSLERLELFEAVLTARGLTPLRELPNLKVLAINTTEISAADVEAVKAALPGVKVEFRPLTEEERDGTLRKKLRLIP